MTTDEMILHLEQNGYTVVPNDSVKIISSKAMIGVLEPDEAAQSRTDRIRRELSRETIPYMVVNRKMNGVSATITIIQKDES